VCSSVLGGATHRSPPTKSLSTVGGRYIMPLQLRTLFNNTITFRMGLSYTVGQSVQEFLEIPVHWNAAQTANQSRGLKNMALTALTAEQIQDALSELPAWETSDGAIRKTYNLTAYLAGVAFAAAVGTVCEGLNHHPEILIGYKRVTVTFTTHDGGNVVTENDIQAAKAVEALGYPKSV